MARLLDRLGARLPGPAAARLPATLRARALRERAAHGDPVEARALARLLLDDDAPGVRRAAAWTLGVLARSGDTTDLAPLLAAADGERCDEVRLAMGVAAVRAGAEVARAWLPIERASCRQVWTFAGERPLAAVVGAARSDMARRWCATLAPGPPSGAHDPAGLRPQDPRAIRTRLRAVLQRSPDDFDALEDLAAQQHPDDLDLLLIDTGLGRRQALRRVVALGLHGDPRATAALVRTLQAIDVDPGHGFSSRAEAGRALGRLGLPEVGATLARALEDEAHDHEGRPGAGLGIQRSVRLPLLVALGECGARHQREVLVAYLSEVSGSAMAGYHLPAMDALIKLDAHDLLLRLAESGPQDAGLNAVGALEALGARAGLTSLSRRGGPIAQAAAVALRRLG